MSAHLQTVLLPDAVRYDLENRLYEPLFMGVPIGATLSAILCVPLSTAPLRALRIWLGWLRYQRFGPRRRHPPPQLQPGRILLTWLGNTARLNQLVLPVLGELGPAQCNVIGGEPSIREQVPPEAGFCTRFQICGTGLTPWRELYLSCREEWNRRIRGWIRDHRLPRWIFPRLSSALCVNSLHIYGAFRFLEQTRPAAILTDSEHNHPWDCLVLAARQLRIPTLQMFHSPIWTSYFYYPLLSDVALCWGAQHREQMISFGVELERLPIVGCQRLTRTSPADRNQVRKRLGLSLDYPVVMLLSGPIPRPHWRQLAYAFGDAFQGCANIAAVVRLHPSETTRRYREEIARYPGIRFIEAPQWTLEESLAACDVVVSHNSGAGNDALVLGRPVVLLDVLDAPMSNGQMLADKAGCPVAKSAEELRRFVRRIATESDYRQSLREQADKYVEWFCSTFGQQAARNVAAEVRRRSLPLASAAPQSSRESSL